MEGVKLRWRELIREERSRKQRLVTALAVNILFAFTLLVFAPYELFITNMDFISFTFGDLWPWMLLLGAAYVLLASCLAMALRGKLFDLFVTAVFAFTLCAYVQGNFLNQDKTILNGAAIAWQNHKREAFLNTLFWMVLFLLPFAVRYFSKKAWDVLLKAGSAFIVAMQLAALFFLLFTTNFDESVKGGYLATEDMFEVSDGQNVIVFILDEFDKSYLDEVLTEDPDYLEPLSGFTYFTNNVSTYFRTYPSIPYLLTREKYFCDIPSNQYLEKAWENASMLKTLKEAGYDIEIYSDRRCIGPGGMELVDNYVREKNPVSHAGMIAGMLDLVFYRDMPYMAKPTFWLYTGDLNTMAVGEEENSSYNTDDALFYVKQLDGLTLTQDAPSFKFYHLNGTHQPYMIDREAHKVTDGTTRTDAAMGSLKIVYNYMEQMKELGVFEDSVIIITADHGQSTETPELEKAVNPILFVKPAGNPGQEPLKYSAAPTSDEDLHATILGELGLKGGEEFGKSVFEWREGEDRKRYKYFQSVVDGKERDLFEFVIHGDANEFSNWSRTGEKWPIRYNFYLW